MASSSTHVAGKTPVTAELLKQGILIAVILAIAIWQHHFVIQSASADIYIFALLFGAAIFGCYNTVRGTYMLRNEFLALEALKQAHEDARRALAEPQDHLQIRLMRFPERAIVYDAPKALGTAHKLIYVELLRSGSLSIPPATMQVLASDLEAKLDERQGMAHYLGALMVLLGLLGTFIGLMHTLESVGGILGSLDLSGNGGTGAIASLIESLKRPLEGMSTGFGASLFGLIGSLVIGILSKFDSKVAHHLQHDFETWLRNAVQIETLRPNDGEVSSVKPEDALTGHWRTVLQVARNTVVANAKLSARQSELVEAFHLFRQQYADRERDWDERFRSILLLLKEESLTQGQMRDGLGTLNENLVEMNADLCSIMGKINRTLDVKFVEQRTLLERNNFGVDRLDDVIGLLSERFGEANDHLRSLSSSMLKNSSESGVVQVPVNRPDELIADLEHLISNMRLRSEDVMNIRKLSRIVGSAYPQGSDTERSDDTRKEVAQ